MISESTTGRTGRYSLVRLDPVEHQLTARGYAAPIDAAAPLEAMTEPYITVATVTVAHDTAFVQATRGTLTREMINDFKAELKRYGVKRFVERRQSANGITIEEFAV